MESTEGNKFYVIINPNAGKGEGLRKWPDIQSKLSELKIDYKFEFSENPGHCKEIVIERIKGSYRKFLCVGGDGTLNEIVNGIFSQTEVPSTDICLGLIPMGTGNDWRRYYNLPENPLKALEIIKDDNILTQDIGEITYNLNGETSKAYFINIAGLGFDSTVVATTNRMKNRGNRTKTTYLLGLLKSLVTYKSWSLKIYINGEVLENKFLSVSIGNGKYSGSGMMQTPEALINDGMLDVTIYDNMPTLKIVLNVKNLYNGKILNINGIKSYRTNSFRIESPHSIFAETDGEIIGDGPYDISIIPNAINIYAPKM